MECSKDFLISLNKKYKPNAEPSNIPNNVRRLAGMCVAGRSFTIFLNGVAGCSTDLFSSLEEQNRKIDQERGEEMKDRKLQNVVLTIKHKYGKNSIIKGMNLEEGGTTIERNNQIGGHHA